MNYVADINGTEATSPRAIQYTLGEVMRVNTTNSTIDPDGGLVEVVRATPNLLMEAAILNGLAQPKDTVQQQVRVVCPTGNCTWEKFETLGVCHRCADLTDDLEVVEGFGDFFNYFFNYYEKPEDERPFFPENVTAMTLPNGHFLANVNECDMYELNVDSPCYWNSPRIGNLPSQLYPMTAYGTGNPNRTNSFKDVDTLIWSMSVIHIDEKERERLSDEWENPHELGEVVDWLKENPWNYWPNNPVRASECAVYYCVKEIESRFEGNVLNETWKEGENVIRTPDSFTPTFQDEDIEEWYAPDNIPDSYGSLEFHDRYSAIPVEPLTLNYTNATGSTSSYIVSEYAVKSISAFFQDTLRYPWSNESKAIEVAREKIPAVEEMWNGMITGFLVRPNALSGVWRDSESNMEERFEALAISMTNDIRKNGGEQSIFDPSGGRISLESEDEPVVGKIGIPTTEYRVVWYWITLHGAMFLGSAIFCVVTMVCSRGVPIWKSHSLATMSQGSAVIDFKAETGSLKELEKRAETMEVSLAGDEQSQLLQRKDANSDREDGHSLQMESSPALR